MKRSHTLIAGVFISCSLLLALSCQSATAQTTAKVQSSGFVENRGQWSEDFSYKAKNGNITTWITKSGLTFDVRGANIKTGRQISIPSKFTSMLKDMVDEELTTHHAIRVDFVGAQTQSFEPNETLEGSYNYLFGQDEKTWVRGVSHFSAVSMKDVYPGVDALVTTDHGTPQYNFIVSPGAKTSQIVMHIDGAQGVETNSSGELIIKTSCGELRNGNIYAYQVIDGAKKEVACAFHVNGNDVQFSVGSYDASKTLVIDPIVYATFIGGDDLDVVTSSTRIPTTGELVIVGYTTSSNFPKTAGAYTSPASGAEDAFVAKFDAKLQKMEFATYVGGAATDKPWDVALARGDGSNDIIVVGETASSNFPTKSGSYKQNQLGGVDAFVFRINNAGSDLKYSTYYGGAAGDDRAYSVVISASSQVILCGSTTSNNLLTSSSAKFKTSQGGMDGFVARIGSTGGTLEWATYYGGNGNDRCTAVGMSSSQDNVPFITGETVSGNLPLAPVMVTTMPPSTKILAPQKTLGGASDAFFAKLNSGATDFTYSTYFGGNGVDFATSILVDNGGVATIAGGTTSTNLTLIQNYQPTKKPGQECLLAELNAAGQAFTMTAYLGGNGDDVALDVATDDGTNLYVVGRTTSSDFPTSDDAEQKTYKTGSDGFLTKLGSYVNLKYSTYIGTAGADSMMTVTVVDAQNAYVGGVVSGGTMKTTDSAAQKTASGPTEGYFAKWTFSSLTVSTPPAGDRKCAGLPLSISWFASNSETGDKYAVEYSSNGGTTWNLIKKDVTATSLNWSIPGTQPGGANYRIRVMNQLTGYMVFNPGVFTVLAAPAVTSTSPDTSLCVGQSVVIAIGATGDGLTYQWRRGGTNIPGATLTSYSINNATSTDSASYDCVVSGNCVPAKTSTAMIVKVFKGPVFLQQPTDVTVNAGKTAHFEVIADGKNVKYRWQKDGSSIPGATNAVYEFFAQNQDKGKYRCIITGDCGTDTSKAVTLDISTSVSEDADADGSLRVSGLVPNPVSDIANVTIVSVSSNPVQLDIVNELGQVVMHTSCESSNVSIGGAYEQRAVLNTSQLSQGSYRIVASSGSHKVFRTFVVQR